MKLTDETRVGHCSSLNAESDRTKTVEHLLHQQSHDLTDVFGRIEIVSDRQAYLVGVCNVFDLKQSIDM